MVNSPAHLLITLIVFVIAVAPAVLLGRYKGRPVLGWVLGLLTGWIGFLILLFVPKTEEKQIAEARQRARIEAAARPPQA